MSPKPATPHLDKVQTYDEDHCGVIRSNCGTFAAVDDVRTACEADILADRATFEAAVRADERRQERRRCAIELSSMLGSGQMFVTGIGIRSWIESSLTAAKPAAPEGTQP